MRISLSSCLPFILYFWVCLSIHIYVVSGHCLEDQQLLLLQLKNQLQFDLEESSKLLSWNQSLPCCDWRGVTCDEKGHVTGLDLSREYISGGFDNSSTLFSLQYLLNLNLAFNYFHSVMPYEIQKLKNLTSLNLSHAGFVEQIPFEISQLTRLVVLDVSAWYDLDGINIMKLVQQLTEVRELYLDDINISLEGTEWCNVLSSSLPHLQVLSMSYCNLSGPIHSSLQMLKNLSLISLRGNNLSGIVPKFFANFSKLTTLDLSSCGLGGRFPEEIFQVQSLSFLDLSHNIGLQGSLPNFPQNGSLHTLILSNTNFSGTFPNSIANLRQLSTLEIPYCQFNGRLPNSLSNLTELTYLDLSFNNFKGPIPPFGMAKKLTLIDLSNNLLSGEISSSHFEGLGRLVSIDLHNNFIRGRIPSSLFVLPSLESVVLYNNRFQGQIDGISNASSFMLETLDLSSNNLEGPLPEFFFHLRRLRTLQLSSNKFTGRMQLDIICGLENLNMLDLSLNNLSIDEDFKDVNQSCVLDITHVYLVSCKLKKFPAFLRNVSGLNFLDLSDNQITGKIPDWIWPHGFLPELNLSHNSLTMIERPPNDVHLGSLDLHDNNLQGSLAFPESALYIDYSVNNFTSIPPDIGNYLSATSFLSLSHNALRERIPHSICNASYIQVLDLSFNNLDGMIPNCLAESEHLGVLNLRNNNLSGNIPDTFSSSCALKTLDLNGNNLKEPIPKSLSKCTNLEVIDLGNNKIHDQFPCLLKNVSSLRVMILRNNNFHGPIWCPKIKGINWNMFQIVDLAHNNFNSTLLGNYFTTWKEMMLDENHVVSMFNLHFDGGCYEAECYSLYYQDGVIVTSKGHEMTLNKIPNVFTFIDFSSNKLEGPIPEEMMDFKGLYGLNLSNNNISGYIPSSIGKMKQLEFLDLSNNSLNGEIPPQLASLSFLGFLNLSFNHLVGMIPTGTQLQSFEADSFKGNDGLYGPPLTKITSDKKPGMLPPPISRDHHKFDLNLITSVELGVVFGLGIIIGPILFWKKWRIRYWKCVDNILCSIFPQLYLDHQRREGQMYTVLRWRR